ncbi:MAG: zinc ABC transporter substrate-binding protein [Acidaminococcaceae bacterium]
MNKKLWSLFLITLTLCLSGCFGGTKQAVEPNKMQVVASFYPMAEFARQVGGDKVQVTTLVADGVEPHDWEPTAQDLGRVAKARLFVYNGGGLEPWADKALVAVADSKVIGVETGHLLFGDKVAAGAATGAHQHVGVDPHVWVSPFLAEKQVEVIAQAFIAADPDNAASYKKNAQDYIVRLEMLNHKLQQVVKTATTKKFVTTHAAFGHLARNYGLVQIPIMGISPEAEPAPADLQRLVATIKDEQIKYVFFETLVSPKVAQTIATAAGIQTLVLDPVEGLSPDGRATNQDYISLMEQNIKNLALALGAAAQDNGENHGRNN